MSFVTKWWIANIIGFLVGYLLYTPIAHGITGHHGRELTGAQIIAHSLAMAVAAFLVVGAQRAALAGHAVIDWWRVPLVMVVFNAAFWLGYYVPFLPIDTDILLGFTVLGTLGWLGAIPAGSGWPRVVLAVLTFAIANFVGQAIAVLVGMSIGLGAEDLQTSMFAHSFYFVTIALVTGLIGGGVSGWLLGPLVTKQRVPVVPRASTGLA